MGCIKSSSKKEVYVNTILPKETRKITKNPKATRERTKRKPKVSRRKESIKIRAEINGTETEKTIEKINKTKSWFFQKTNKIPSSF